MYDASLDTINTFISNVWTIMNNTLRLADSFLNGSNKGVLAYMASKHIDQVAQSRDELLRFIDTMKEESNNTLDAVADALARNGELDYEYGIAVVPPSEVVFNFEITLENLMAIWDDVIQEARERLESGT